MKTDFNKVSFEKAKDLILSALVSDNEKLLNSKQFQEELFINASLEDVNFLLKSILDSKLDLLKGHVGRQVYITAIGNIRPFLKNGGFEKIEFNKIQKEKKDSYDSKISKRNYHTFWCLFIFTFIVFCLNCYNFYNDYPSKSINNYEERLHKLEDKIQKLEALNKNNNPTIQSPAIRSLPTSD